MVSKELLAENDYNCNIRRYDDNAPPPEPQDVRAHLLGGIPKAEAEIKEIEAQLQPYKEIKTRLNAAKKELRQLKTQLVARLGEARQGLSEDACQKLVLDIFREGIRTELERYVTAHRQQVISAVENWWDKYRVTLLEIEKGRDEAAKRLDEFLKTLGYTND